MINKTFITSTEDSLWRNLRKQYSIIEKTDVFEKIQTEINEWRSQVFRNLGIENPFHDDFEKLKKVESDLQQGNFALKAIEGDISDFHSFKHRINSPMDEFWQEQLTKLKKSYSSLPKKSRKKKNNITQADIDKEKEKQNNQQVGMRASLQKKWREELEEIYSEWEFDQINNYRRNIFEKLKSWLELLQKLFNLLSDLSIEPGLLFDLSKDNLTDTDIEKLRRWVEYISQDEGVKNLCDMLGRLRQAEQSKKEEIIKLKTKISMEIPNTSSIGEIVGVTLGRNIENTIPEELTLLSDDECSILFDLKFTENRLMCFETQSLQQDEIEIEKEKKIEIIEDEKMGPVIICVDSSGSMQGSPETIAKAITLYIATRAASQDRNCYLINFSTHIETIDLSNNVGFSKIIEFLKKSFHGGTDVAPALVQALKTIQKEDYQQSDVLIISDFVMGRLPKDLCTGISNAKKQKNKFYSLCIGECFIDKKLKNIFDKEWAYNPNTKSIHEIYDFIHAID